MAGELEFNCMGAPLSQFIVLSCGGKGEGVWKGCGAVGLAGFS